MNRKLLFQIYNYQLSFLFVVATFSYPFFFRNLNTTIYSLIFNGSIVFSFFFLFLVLKNGYKIQIDYSMIRKKEILLFLLFYAMYVLSVFIVNIQFYAGSGVDIKEVLSWFRNIFLVLIFFLFLSQEVLKSLLKYYVIFVLILSVTSIAQTFLIYSDLISSYGSIDVNGAERDLYIFGFRWMDSWLGDYYHFPRLQSFTDEAGTMAFAILPAIIIGHIKKYYISVIIMVVALFMTFSAGAIFLFLVISMFYALKQRHFKTMVIFAILLVSLVLANGDFLLTYSEAKFGGGSGQSSADVRYEDIKIALDAVSSHIFGMGITSITKLDIALAVGWLLPLVNFGIISYTFYLLAFLSLLWLVLKDQFSRFSINRYLSLIILIFYYSALQRTQIDYNVWNWFWIIAYIRLREDV